MVLIRRIFSPSLSKAPVLSAAAYAKRKKVLSLYFLVWGSLLIYLYLRWFDLPLIVRVILGFIEFIFAPDIDVAKEIIKSYEKYEAERIRE